MQLEKKYISKNNWKRVIDREDAYTPIEEENLTGEASLLHIKKVTSPCIKEYENKFKVEIANDNFYWLQLAIKDKKYWITAMYNNKKELIQYYIDITRENVVNNNASFFYDLFLDIVILNGQTTLLDEEELNNALDENVITQEEYIMAKEEAKRIISKFSKDTSELDKLCEKYFRKLLKQLESK